MAPSVFLVWLTPVSKLGEITLGSVLSESRDLCDEVSIVSMLVNNKLLDPVEGLRL